MKFPEGGIFYANCWLRNREARVDNLNPETEGRLEEKLKPRPPQI
jgi:hypothetical protein